MSRADMESAGPARQSLQAAGKLPDVLSASVGLGWARLAMMVDQSRRKRRWGNGSFLSGDGCSGRESQAGIAKL